MLQCNFSVFFSQLNNVFMCFFDEADQRTLISPFFFPSHANSQDGNLFTYSDYVWHNYAN